MSCDRSSRSASSAHGAVTTSWPRDLSEASKATRLPGLSSTTRIAALVSDRTGGTLGGLAPLCSPEPTGPIPARRPDNGGAAHGCAGWSLARHVLGLFP